ncbi:hypothetical protein C0992_012752 [Termitomyces sp. T32_za158]|nr:hypothetical protein C0992_012752 [Termitomyces sp. T32_za158]
MKKVGPTNRGLAESSHASGTPGPSKSHWGHKPPIMIDWLEVVDFPADIPEWAGPTQMLFLKAILIPAPPTQLMVVVVPTDLRTPVQYDGLTVTAAADKSKQRMVPSIDNDSNYGELPSKEEEEEGKTPTQRFQHIQQNKKLTQKKANKAKNAAALVHRMQNDFLRHIPNGLGVKIWGPLDDLVNPMQGPKDLGIAERQHIPLHYTHVKDDGMVALRIMRTPDPNKLLNLEQIAQYALIFGCPGMENTWQGIVADFAYWMHWRTLFGFAFCHTLCINSAGKMTLVYEKPFKAQQRAQLTIYQLHVPDDQVHNFSDEDVLRILLYNRIPLEWVDHAYAYCVVYLKQQFHQPIMSLDIFCEIDNEHLKHLKLYGTPLAIPRWDGWQETTEEDQYHLMFKQTEESTASLFPEANGLYCYIGMDPNVGQLWKRTLMHGTIPSIGVATNVALTDCDMVDMTVAGSPTTPLIMESEPLSPVTNITNEESTKTTKAGRNPLGKKMG